MTKTEQLLIWMKAQPAGCTLREIQTFLLKLDPETRKHIDPKTGYRYRHKRGWWGTNLYENSPYDTNRVGILNKYCQKINGRWLVTEPIVGPFYRMVETKSYRMNRVRKKQEYRDYVARLPKCKHCGKAVFNYTDTTPDGACINTSSANGYVIDCQERVWATKDYRHTDLTMGRLTTLTREQVYHLSHLYDSNPDYEGKREHCFKDIMKFLVN